MLRNLILAGTLLLAVCMLDTTSARAGEDEGSGLPIPRFVAFKSDLTNVRTGPGVRYPISWVYKREGMPVEIIDEYDQWRKIRDQDGTTGWVHKSLLDGKRRLMITGKIRVMRADPEEDALAVLRASPGVIGQLVECGKEWCKAQIESRKGWLKKKDFWGAYAKEEFEK